MTDRLLLSTKDIRNYLKLFSEDQWDVVVQLTLAFGIQQLKNHFNLTSLSVSQLQDLLQCTHLSQVESYLRRERPDWCVFLHFTCFLNHSSLLLTTQSTQTQQPATQQQQSPQPAQQTRSQPVVLDESTDTSMLVDYSTAPSQSKYEKSGSHKSKPKQLLPSAKWRLGDDNTGNFVRLHVI